MTAVALVQHQNRTVLAIKVALRLAALPADRPSRVLDCFAGDHDIWDIAQEINRQPVEVLHNDRDLRYRSHLAMAAVDAVRFLDLDGFDLVDLDAWTPPYDELLALSMRQYSGVVAYTSILANSKPHHESPMEEVGIAREWHKPEAPLLAGRDATPAERWVTFLDTCGWERTHIVQTLGRRSTLLHLYGVCGGYEHFDTNRYEDLYQAALRSRRMEQAFRQ